MNTLFDVIIWGLLVGAAVRITRPFRKVLKSYHVPFDVQVWMDLPLDPMAPEGVKAAKGWVTIGEVSGKPGEWRITRLSERVMEKAFPFSPRPIQLLYEAGLPTDVEGFFWRFRGKE